jgi:predicted MFS family arabinose efflux permease
VGGPLSGVIADHYNRRRLMILADIGRAVLLVVVPTLSSSQLWAIFPLTVVLYALNVIFNTAASAALPDVVPRPKLMSANATLQGLRTAADLAYAFGGVLVFLLGLRAPFYIDAATFLFSSLMIAAMRIPQPAARSPLRIAAVAAHVREGIGFTIRQPFLRWSTLTMTVAPMAGGVIFVLTPLYASRTLSHGPGLVGPLHSGAFRFSVLEVALGMGALLGSALAPRLSRRWRAGRVYGLGMLGIGVSYALLAPISSIYLAALVVSLTGASNSLFLISGATLIQRLAPSEIRGRVVAVRVTVIHAALAAGSALGGALVLGLTYPRLWLLMGAVIAAASAFVWLRPEVRAQA